VPLHLQQLTSENYEEGKDDSEADGLVGMEIPLTNLGNSSTEMTLLFQS